MTDATAEIDDLGRLSEFTAERGYSRWKALVIFLVGCIPALLVAMATQGRNGTVPIIALLLVIGPTAALFIWTLRDRDAQDARELGMWVRVVQRAGEFGVGAKIRRELPEVPPAEEVNRISLRDTATEYRETLTPLIASPGVLGLRIAAYRWWYVVGSLIVTVLAAVTLVIVSPSFT
jgi:hypothetical protein